jgi:hypothetical protein
MFKKRKAKKRTTDYKPVFTNAEFKLMQNYCVGDLLDEVGVNRVMLMRTLDKMNKVHEQLTFRDHLDALRAVAYSTGRIASLLDTRERLYQPYLEERKRYREYMDKVNQIITDLGVSAIGQEKWDDIQLDAWLQVMAKGNNGDKNGS